MHNAVAQAIKHFYPKGLLQSPLADSDIRWNYDTDHGILKSLMAQLKTIDQSLRPGTRCDYEIAEELLLGNGELGLMMSYIGPFAAFSRNSDEQPVREIRRQVEALLEKHDVILLEDDDLSEPVPALKQAAKSVQVGNCLFVREQEFNR